MHLVKYCQKQENFGDFENWLFEIKPRGLKYGKKPVYCAEGESQLCLSICTFMDLIV